jgi:hypothetical protein
MWTFYFENVQFSPSQADTMNILEKLLFWCQKWIFKSLGEFYIETVKIKVVDNNSNYNLSEIIYF